LQLKNAAGAEKAAIEVYNGKIVQPANGGDLRYIWNTSSPLQMEIIYDQRRRNNTVLRMQIGEQAFAVSVCDVIEKGYVYIQETGLLVTPASSTLTFDEVHKKHKNSPTVLTHVRQLPDQSFSQAMDKVHKRDTNRGPIMLSLACSNQKFIVEENGVMESFTDTEIDPDAPQYMQRRHGVKLTPVFGFGKAVKTSRCLFKEFLPVPVTTMQENGVSYRHTSFVSPYGPQLPDHHPWINRQSLFVAEMKVSNTLDKPADASIKFSLLDLTDYQASRRSGERLARVEQVVGGIMITSGDNLLAYLDTTALDALKWELQNSELHIRGSLAANASESLLIYIPGWKLGTDDFDSLVGGLDLIAECESYWKGVLSQGMRIRIPDQLLQNALAASVVHCLIAARNDASGAIFVPWASSIHFGPLESEAHSIIYGMDLMGFHDFSQRSLDFFLNQFKPEGYLTTGYTLMGMGQHLWTLGEHFRLSEDREWLNGHAPTLAKACEWIIRQREKTQMLDAHDQKVPEYGLMPPGVAADWNRFDYRFVLQGYFCGGLSNAAHALNYIGYPKSEAYLQNARHFRQSILSAYHWTQARSLVVALRDGMSVPYCPSMIYCFGRVADTYGTEDVGRAWCYDAELGAHHLVPMGVISPDDKNVQWMVEQLEDLEFLQPGHSYYTEAELKNDWFNLGGFSKLQPYYTRIAQIYAMTDDVKPFIRSYFNAIATMLNTEILSFWEHFNGTGAWNKTHETGWFLAQSRTMFVMEKGDDLWLAPFATHHWMEDGMEIRIDRASTRFGSISYAINSVVEKGYIEAVIMPDFKKSPRKTFIRLRHPDGKPLSRVFVNGAEHRSFNTEKECVELNSLNRHTIVRAEY
jgi:hypothetical protein